MSFIYPISFERPYAQVMNGRISVVEEEFELPMLIRSMLNESSNLKTKYSEFFGEFHVILTINAPKVIQFKIQYHGEVRL